MGGAKKEYLPLPGADASLTVLGAAVSAFAAVPEIRTIVIVVPEDTETGESVAQGAVAQGAIAQSAIARNALPPEIFDEKAGPIVRFVTGGSTRRASVFNALRALAAGAPNYVLIHDGARPWISPALIERVIRGVKQYSAVIPLLPLTETPKETNLPLDGNLAAGPVFIKQQLKRAVIGTAQTPQAFAFPEILTAHEKAAAQEGGGEFTDDAEVWAEFCGPVAVIPGEIGNRTITFPEDMPC
jgi:2-C-methyl-D-erythritol 4-phosphate cytidylyltransferase